MLIPRDKYAVLPEEYHILPVSIDFRIPEFLQYCAPGDKTLALRERDCVEWYEEFVELVISRLGNGFLPICRMSDGEYLFALGEQPPDVRHSIVGKINHRLIRLYRTIRGGFGFRAITQQYQSGQYSAREWNESQETFRDLVRQISKKGIVALHLSYGHKPFQEHFFPALGRWLRRGNINLNDMNYYPFYFVYALLTGGRRVSLLKERRVLVVNSALGEKRQKIIQGLLREGVKQVSWVPISSSRSLFDAIDVDPFHGNIDIVLVGAGIGKPNILMQLEPLQVPCIDVGFVFEIWANPSSRWKRAFCAPDYLRLYQD